MFWWKHYLHSIDHLLLVHQIYTHTLSRYNFRPNLHSKKTSLSSMFAAERNFGIVCELVTLLCETLRWKGVGVRCPTLLRNAHCDHLKLLDQDANFGLIYILRKLTRHLNIYRPTPTHTHARTHAHTHARTHAHTHTHARTHTKENPNYICLFYFWDWKKNGPPKLCPMLLCMLTSNVVKLQHRKMSNRNGVSTMQFCTAI